MSADAEPDDVEFAFDDGVADGEGCSSVGCPGHFPIVPGALDFLDAQPRPKPCQMATLNRQQVSFERLQAIAELGLLRRGQSFQVAQK